MMQKKLSESERRRCKDIVSLMKDPFPWKDTPEEWAYWRDVWQRMGAMAEHGTTDGKPWVEPVRVPTDEDAKQRPTVMVRENKGQLVYGSHAGQWIRKTLVAVAGGEYPFVTDTEYVAERWKECRFPIEGE